MISPQKTSYPSNGDTLCYDSTYPTLRVRTVSPGILLFLSQLVVNFGDDSGVG